MFKKHNRVNAFAHIERRASYNFKKKLYLRLAKSSHSLKSLVVINRHDPWDNWTSDSNLATVIIEFKKYISVIEKLSDNNIRSCINLQKEVHK